MRCWQPGQPRFRGLLRNVVQLSRKPVASFTPPTSDETARFVALLDQLDPIELPAIAAMLRSLVEKT
jgi:hypothetical protein